MSATGATDTLAAEVAEPKSSRVRRARAKRPARTGAHTCTAVRCPQRRSEPLDNCRHVGCTWVSTADSSQKRRQAALRHELTLPSHVAHFAQAGAACDVCQRNLASQRWAVDATGALCLGRAAPPSCSGGAKRKRSASVEEPEPSAAGVAATPAATPAEHAAEPPLPAALLAAPEAAATQTAPSAGPPRRKRQRFLGTQSNTSASQMPAPPQLPPAPARPPPAEVPVDDAVYAWCFAETAGPAPGIETLGREVAAWPATAPLVRAALRDDTFRPTQLYCFVLD